MSFASRRSTPRASAVAAADSSSTEALKLRLRGLHDHCLTNLTNGLDAMGQGDMTVEVVPVTEPIDVLEVDEGVRELVELFNAMLSKAQAGIIGYNAMRQRLQQRVEGMVGEIGALAAKVAASSQQLTTSSQQVGTAVDEIAKATTTVAEGAERQVGLVRDARAATQEAVTMAGTGGGQGGARAHGRDLKDRRSDESAGAQRGDRGRPGSEQGRGFAVVADEVRKLAESASKTADQTRDAFHGLSASIETVSGCVDRAAETTEQVAAVAEETSAATQQVSASAQESSASTLEIGSSSEDLARMAGDLDRLVGTFSV